MASRHRRKKTRPPVGARPGTLAIPSDWPKPVLCVMQYAAEGELVEKQGAQLADIDPETLPAGSVTWLDVHGLGDEQVIRGIGQRFGLHVLELEDIVHIPQRPKADVQGKHLFLVTRMPHRKGEELDIEQVSIFVGDRYVLTFQERPGDVFAPVRERLRQGMGQMRRSGPGYLAYALLDAIVDAYFPIVEALGTELENLEGEVIETQQPWMLADLNRIRAELLRIRRILSPQREALSSMLKEQSAYMGQDVQIYLRDTYDHVVQLLDVIESQREIGSGILNTYLTLVANRTNDVMKVLTIMASIFIPLTFMAGIYGMNFERMPELAWPWGYPALLVAMAAVGAGMLVYFRRKGWLGGEG